MSADIQEERPTVPSYSYRDIARLYRDEFRDKFQEIVFPLDESDLGEEKWKRRRVFLECDQNTRVNGAIIVIDFNSPSFDGANGEESEVLAANTVDVAGGQGRYLGTINLNRALYRQTSGLETQEHLRYRKCVIAHEWLEVMYAICNGERNQARAINGNVQLAALLAELNHGLPMEDRQEHWDDLVIGLREVLVSKGTLEKKLSKLKFDTVDDFRQGFQAAASNDWLQKHANIISAEIHVDPKLITERLLELIREPRT